MKKKQTKNIRKVGRGDLCKLGGVRKRMGVRPDGCSLHKTESDFDAFLEKYWAGMPDEVPDEYSRPAGEPVKAYVTKTLYEEIKKSKNGIRLWSFEKTKAVKAKQLVYGTERSGWVEYK